MPLVMFAMSQPRASLATLSGHQPSSFFQSIPSPFRLAVSSGAPSSVALAAQLEGRTVEVELEIVERDQVMVGIDPALRRQRLDRQRRLHEIGQRNLAVAARQREFGDAELAFQRDAGARLALQEDVGVGQDREPGFDQADRGRRETLQPDGDVEVVPARRQEHVAAKPRRITELRHARLEGAGQAAVAAREMDLQILRLPYVAGVAIVDADGAAVDRRLG